MNQDHRWEATARESATSAAAVQAEDAARARRRWITLGVVAGSLLIFAVAAIAWSPGSPRLEANRDNAAALDTHKQIFQEVVRRINNLDSTIALDMSTEDVIVLNTEGGEAPLAVLTDDPDRPGDQFTRLRVVNGSPLFVTRGVRGREGNHPGDAVYYYAQVDTSDKEYQVYRGLTQPKAFALEVDRVIDEDTLLVHGGLSGPVEQPFRLEVRRRVYTTNIHTDVKKWMKQNPAETDWEPSPDRQTLVQMVEHLNQWIGELSDGWDAAYQREPLLDSLAPVGDPIASYFLPPVLQRQQFDYHDARMLEETTWLRDIKNLVGDQPTDLEKARKLFDWTIRNVQLEDPASRFGRLPRRPWQTLMYGGGTALERAWTFMLLARQARLDVVMLSYPDPQRPEVLKFWAPALVSQDGRLYLFDAELGLPIAGPGGQGVATLDEVLADESVLAALDVDDLKYATRREHLAGGLVAFIEASPHYFTARMKRLEEELSGRDSMVLSAAPSTAKTYGKGDSARTLVEVLQGGGGVREVRLWPLAGFVAERKRRLPPAERQNAWEALQVFVFEPTLWKGRLLHLQGQFDPVEATAAISRRGIGAPLASGIRPTKGAVFFYLSRRLPEHELKVDQVPAHRDDLRHSLRILRALKRNSSYWLGQIMFERGDYGSAISYFQKLTASDTKTPDNQTPDNQTPDNQTPDNQTPDHQTPDNQTPDNQTPDNQTPDNQTPDTHQPLFVNWSDGARYNLARSYEALAQREEDAGDKQQAATWRRKAIELLETGADSPQHHGDLLRARMLKQTADPQAAGGENREDPMTTDDGQPSP